MVYPSAEADRSALPGFLANYVRAIPAHVAWPVVVASLLYVMLLALGPKLLNDADTYWQIALGDWMIANRAVPTVDVYSWTVAGQPWISSQWLAQVIFAAAYDALGWSGVVALSALAIASAFGLLTYYLMRHLAPTPALVLTMAAVVLPRRICWRGRMHWRCR